ncbi:MAG: alpha-amylase family glycosyl hydrolase [Christensenellales bacterium]
MWADVSVFYHIYPLGFCGAPKDNDGKIVNRIAKVLSFADHLKKLGVNAIYFSPVFQSDSHGYDTRDFKTIDCRLGSNSDFADVCRQLHEKGFKIVLDGVFNHVGRGFWAFRDVLENKFNSRYKDWFMINFAGNSCYNDGFWYEGWEGHYELVKLNLNNNEVVEYILGCVKSWVDEFDVDGLRLDVAYCLNENFMRRLREFTNRLKADFWLVGEILFGDYNRIVNDGMLHSCTNYECYKGLYSSFNSNNMFEIAHSLNRQFGYEYWTLYKGKHLLSFADNHDVTRITSLLTDKNAVYPLYGILFGMPGIPCIYYGSEWGTEGKKEQGSDDSLRPSFEKPEWNSLTDFISKLAAARKNSEALKYGGYKNVVIFSKQLAFERATDDETVIVLINADSSEFEFNLGNGGESFYEMICGEEVTSNDGKIVVMPYGVKFLKRA